MFVQIIKSAHDNAWYKKKMFQEFEVKEDETRKNLYRLVEDPKKAILKTDCIEVEK